MDAAEGTGVFTRQGFSRSGCSQLQGASPQMHGHRLTDFGRQSVRAVSQDPISPCRGQTYAPTPQALWMRQEKVLGWSHARSSGLGSVGEVVVRPLDEKSRSAPASGGWPSRATCSSCAGGSHGGGCSSRSFLKANQPDELGHESARSRAPHPCPARWPSSRPQGGGPHRRGRREDARWLRGPWCPAPRRGHAGRYRCSRTRWSNPRRSFLVTADTRSARASRT